MKTPLCSSTHSVVRVNGILSVFLPYSTSHQVSAKCEFCNLIDFRGMHYQRSEETYRCIQYKLIAIGRSVGVRWCVYNTNASILTCIGQPPLTTIIRKRVQMSSTWHPIHRHSGLHAIIVPPKRTPNTPLG